jgi:hypothetical protein
MNTSMSTFMNRIMNTSMNRIMSTFMNTVMNTVMKTCVNTNMNTGMNAFMNTSVNAGGAPHEEGRPATKPIKANLRGCSATAPAFRLSSSDAPKPWAI